MKEEEQCQRYGEIYGKNVIFICNMALPSCICRGGGSQTQNCKGAKHVSVPPRRTENLRHVKFLQCRIHAGEVLVVASGIVLPDAVQLGCCGCPDHG